MVFPRKMKHKKSMMSPSPFLLAEPQRKLNLCSAESSSFCCSSFSVSNQHHHISTFSSLEYQAVFLTGVKLINITHIFTASWFVTCPDDVPISGQSCHRCRLGYISKLSCSHFIYYLIKHSLLQRDVDYVLCVYLQ